MFLPFFVCGGVGGILEVCVCVCGGGVLEGYLEHFVFLFLCGGGAAGRPEACSVLFFFCVGGVLEGYLKHFVSLFLCVCGG